MGYAVSLEACPTPRPLEPSDLPRMWSASPAPHPAEQGVALLGDLAESLFVGGRVDRGGQTDVAHDMLTIGEAREGAQDEHGGERRQGADSRMREQELDAGIGARDGGDVRVELVDPRRQPGEQRQAVIASARRVRGQGQGLQLGEPPLGPQRRVERQPLVEGDRLQAVLDHRPHPDQPDAVRDQGAPIPGVGIGDPHRGEAVVLEQVEQVPGVAPIGLRLAHDHGPDLRGLADQHRMAELVHEGVKPLGVARRLDPDRHGRRQRAVEPLHGVAFVGELLFDELAGAGVEHSNLLLARVQVTSDECHDRGRLFLRAVALGLSEGSSSARPFS